MIGSKSEVVGFWNIYADGPYYKDIVAEQQRVLYSSGLMVLMNNAYLTLIVVIIAI